MTNFALNHKDMKSAFFKFFTLILISASGWAQAQTFVTPSGQISFTSEAPLEVIEASSKKVKGAIDASKSTFAFSMPIVSFEGFNSALQREHFNENYMESAKYPDAVFTGKIIEQVNFTTPGKYSIRAKGILKIHGVEQERIIKSEVVVKADKSITVTSSFTVPLADHKITIPRIVNQKIATEIKVSMKAEMKAK